MDLNKVIEYLEKNDLTEIEEIAEKDNCKVVKFYYDFDKDELEAAKAYSKDECEEDENSNEWYDEYFLPYLNDIAIDNVGEIMEETMDEFEIKAQFICYELNKDNYEYLEFIAIFYKNGDYDIEDILDSLDI